MVGVLVVTLLLGALPVRAAQWYELYERALEAEGRGAWAEALDLFVEAERYRSGPEERVRTYGNRFLFGYDPAFHRARCLAELGRLDEARSALAVSAAAAVTAEEDLAALRERLDRIGAQLDAELQARRGASEETAETAEAAETVAPGHLDIHSSPRGVRIEIDGRPGGSTPVEEVQVTPGTHRVRLVDQRPGSNLLPWEQEVEVLPGERVHLDVTLARRPPAVGDEREPPSPSAQEEPRQRRERRRGQDVEQPAPQPGPGASEPAPTPVETEAAATGADGAPEAQPASAEPPAPTGPGESQGAPDEPASEAAADGSPSAERPNVPTLVGALLAALVLVAGGLAVGRARSRRSNGRGGSTATGASDRRIGGRIGGYRIEEVLGRGGMATSYRARRLGDRQEVALKIPHETGDPSYAERFVREGRLGETLHHPGIVRILEAGQDDGQAFLAMELLPGHTLRELMDSAESPLPVERCLAIVREIAEALDYAHSKGVVHRDLKPENVMVLPDGALRVMDFGVARVEGQPGLTNSQFFFGSPVYAAPELVDPRSIDHRADLYSLGVLLYELLEGEPPFVHESIFKLLEMHQREPLPNPEGLPRALPPAVWRLVARMLAKTREARYASAQELLVDLKRLLYAASDDTAQDTSPPADV